MPVKVMYDRQEDHGKDRDKDKYRSREISANVNGEEAFISPDGDILIDCDTITLRYTTVFSTGESFLVFVKVRGVPLTGAKAKASFEVTEISRAPWWIRCFVKDYWPLR